jgi:hypothetical protein
MVVLATTTSKVDQGTIDCGGRAATTGSQVARAMTWFRVAPGAIQSAVNPDQTHCTVEVVVTGFGAVVVMTMLALVLEGTTPSSALDATA